MKSSALHCQQSDLCPIGQGPCPGVCVYADIFENIDLGIIVFDMHSAGILFANRCAEDLIGAGIGPHNFQHLKSLFLDRLQCPIPDLVGHSYDIQLDDKLLGYTFYPVSDQRFLWMFMRNITEKMRFESVANAVSTMDNLGYVFSGIRHEIGNPLNSAKMALTVLRESFHDFSRTEALEFVDRSLEELQRVEFLLRSLRNLNMYEKSQPENIHFPHFLDRFVSLVWEDFSQKGITINTAFHPQAKWALVDPRSLQQVLLNIFTNAADALEESVERTIELSTRAGQGFLWVRIVDSGCGISAEELAEIFKPFYTTKVQGTGLGLVICRKMLAQMNCTIEISSTLGQGTRVEISIPEGQADDVEQES